MPKYWKSRIKDKEDDTPEQIEKNDFNRRIAANKKPYFFIYNYDKLYSQYRKFMLQASDSYTCEYGKELEDGYKKFLADSSTLSDDERTFFEWFEILNPVDNSPCVVNKICWYIENQIGKLRQTPIDDPYDYKRLKSPDPLYSKHDYYAVKDILSKEYQNYRIGMKELNYKINNEYIHGFDRQTILQDYVDSFIMRLNIACPNEELRCDVLLDIAYKSNSSKKFVWEICGKQIIRNLLKRHGNRIEHPVQTDIRPDFMYHGVGYSMVTTVIDDTEFELE